MKILQINCVYAVGSTGKITRDLHTQLLAAGHEAMVLYGRGPTVREPGVYRVCGNWYGKANHLRARLTGLAYGGCLLSTARILRIISREKPEVVHLQCINGDFCNLFYLLTFLKAAGIPTVLTLHAEFPYTGTCGTAGACMQWLHGCHRCDDPPSRLWNRTEGAWRRLERIYAGWDRLTVVGPSRWISARAAQSGALGGARIRTIPNGIDNETIFFPRAEAGALRRRLGLRQSEQMILFVAPDFSMLKGFDYFLTLAEACRDLPFRFFAAGKGRANPSDCVTNLGWVSDQSRLAELYTAADVLVVCSRSDNFPTVCMEAASCGTPVVGFRVGGVQEAIPAGMGMVTPCGDIPAMREALLRVTQARPSPATVAKARAQCCRERMAERYMALYQGILEEG